MRRPRFIAYLRSALGPGSRSTPLPGGKYGRAWERKHFREGYRFALPPWAWNRDREHGQIVWYGYGGRDGPWEARDGRARLRTCA